MNSFFDLVGFEYKKILKRKSTLITLGIVFCIITMSFSVMVIGNYYVGDEIYENKYEAIIKDRNYARELTGRAIDEDLIMETQDAYSKVPNKVSYSDTPEYEEYGRPYSGVYRILSSIYDKDIRNLDKKDAQNFYSLRHSLVEKEINETLLSNKSKKKLIQLDSEIKIPFIFEHTDGYQRFFSMVYITGIMIAFAVAICISPIFAGEYSSGVDKLILSSRYGKNKLSSAKIFTGITFSIMSILIFMAYTWLLSMMVFGFDGGDAPIQFLFPLSAYSISLREGILIFSTCILFSIVFLTAIIMWLSSKFKSPFGVIVLTSVLIFVPMMIHISDNDIVIHNLFHLLPSNMIFVVNVFSPILYEFFGLCIEPYVFMPIFAVSATIILLPFTYRSFKRHQIS
ncbi:ABC transporter permease [Vallitalea longa]|uniref:ABC transporter permease n=1 Tax=Vallitalea longa TaxID=2936439 RepID=A0A9W6DDU2_9FIRM|nr:ABC transporter permease subunit [Vallitalea longa]GKX28725.1 ABC transporter permease [Vallitalea longa]